MIMAIQQKRTREKRKQIMSLNFSDETSWILLPIIFGLLTSSLLLSWTDADQVFG